MLSVKQAVALHCEFRDHIADVVDGIHKKKLNAAFSIVLFQNFGYCFNTYKTIGLLIPEFYYEQGCALLRIMWESSVNLAWICIKPIERSRTYLQFTVVEQRKVYQSHIMHFEAIRDSVAAKEAREILEHFEKEYGRILDEYRETKGKRQRRLAQRFSLGNLEHIVNELGEHWLKEYKILYPLLCFYAHGSPGAVVFPNPYIKDTIELTPEAYAEYDHPRTVKIALWSMAIMERSYRILIKNLDINDAPYLDDLNLRSSFRNSLEW